LSAPPIDNGRSGEGKYLEEVIEEDSEADLEGKGSNEGNVDDGDNEEDEGEHKV